MRGGGRKETKPAAGKRKEEENEMLSSLADLMDDDESLGAGSGIRAAPPGVNFTPKATLVSGLKAVEQDFTQDLGSNWFEKVSSDDSSLYPESFASLPSSATNSSGDVLVNDSFDGAVAQNVALAAHFESIKEKLDKLDRKQLLGYAARLSMLAGNFYKMAANSNSSADALSPQSLALHGQQQSGGFSPRVGHFGQSSQNNSGSSQALIDWASTSRPLSSMTTFSDMGNLQFSASTASLAHLPAVNEHSRAQVEGDIDEGTKTINDYVIVAPIGSGSFGTVELGVTLSGDPRAIKAVKRSALLGRNEAMVKREIALMKKLRHDNVVRLYEVIDDPSSNVIYLVMKYCSNGPLVNVRNDFTCDTIPIMVAKTLLRQLISGLHYLHLRRIVHRDIKPDNILLDHANVPCFIDFGVSGTVHKKSRTAVTEGVEGTPVFWAPELFARKNSIENKSKQQKHEPAPPVDLMAADVYSLGATFYTAICGVPPYVGKNQEELAQNVLKQSLKLPDYLSASWKDLFEKMLEKDPAKRMKIPELKLHKVFTEDVNEGNSAHDDLRVSEDEISSSMSSLRKEFSNSNESVNSNSIENNDGDVDPTSDFFAPHTPKKMKTGGAGGGGGASNRNMFHRKVPATKKVAASTSSSSSHTTSASASPPTNFVGGHSQSSPSLTRSYSTSRMPLRNIVKASDNSAPPPNAPSTARGSSSGASLPPVQNVNKRPSSGLI